MNIDELKQQIAQERANETNAAIQLGVAMGRRAAFEEMLAAAQMEAAVEQAKQKAVSDE